MILKLAALAAAPAALVAGLDLFVGPMVAVVDVREGGPEGHRLVVPVPLVVVQVALAFAPDETIPAPDPELVRLLPSAERMVEELRGAPDAELIRVEERGETVSVRKVGRSLEVDVRGAGEEVHAVVPLEAVSDLLQRYGEDRLTARDLGGVLSKLSRGEVVHVRDGQSEIKVSFW